MKRPKSDYNIQTVTNALRLLEAFEDAEALGVTELSRRLDLHKNNVFRLLATLEEKGYVEQASGTDHYRLGVLCLELGQSFARTRGVVAVARPMLRRLVEELGETVHLGVLQDFEVAHLDGEMAQRIVTTRLRLGQRLPAHCTALGKVLLGCANPAQQERFDRSVVEPEGLAKRTAATIVDREKLFEHLRTVASDGYALDQGECEEDLCCAAAPLYDAEGNPIAALSVSLPSTRARQDRLLGEIVPRLLSATEQISRQLGFGTL